MISDNLKRLIDAKAGRVQAAARLAEVENALKAQDERVDVEAAMRADEVVMGVVYGIDFEDQFARAAGIEIIRKLLYEIYRTGPLVSMGSLYNAMDRTRDSLNRVVEKTEMVRKQARKGVSA